MRLALAFAAIVAVTLTPAPGHAQIVNCDSGDWDSFTACVQKEIVSNRLPYHCETWRGVAPTDPNDHQYRALCSSEPLGLEPVLHVYRCEAVSPGTDEWRDFWICIWFWMNWWDEGGRTCRVFTEDLDGGGYRAEGICRDVVY